MNKWVGADRVGLGWVGPDTAGQGWVGPDTVGLAKGLLPYEHELWLPCLALCQQQKGPGFALSLFCCHCTAVIAQRVKVWAGSR